MAGKPAFELTGMHLRVIEDMAGRGAVLDDIAYVIGCAPITLDRIKKKNADVMVAYNRGRATAKDHIAGKLYDLCNEGDVVAIIFWLKAQAGWRDKPEETPVLSESNVVVYLPSNGRELAGKA